MERLSSILFFIVLCGRCFAQTLPLEEMVGQLLMAHFQGSEANENAKRLIQNVKVGGIIYYRWANGLQNREQVAALSEGLQHLAGQNPNPIPLFIAVDQEGGRVIRLTEGFTKIPSQRVLAQKKDRASLEQVGSLVGKELLSVGINMNLSPVVDVNSNPSNPVIADRSFSQDPQIVSLCAEQILKGYREAGIVGVLKHFPGHGDTSVDSHQDLPVVLKSREALEKTELVPFRALAPQADAVMTAHILVPALDPDYPSTLSEKTLAFLREEIGFTGLIISDSLVMGGILKICKTPEEAAIQAIRAGCDLVILGGRFLVGERAGCELTAADVQNIHRAIVLAVEEGRLSEKRIEEAARRVLHLKRELKLSLFGSKKLY